MDELENKLNEYENLFNSSFPAFCFMHLSQNELIDVIDKCLEAGKDVYELGILSDDPDIKY